MTYGTALVDTIQSSTTGTPTQFQDGSGNQIGTLCRAWVNFTGSNGTRNASFNVSSVTYNGTGSYTVNFTNALSDANYAISVNPSTNASNGYLIATVNDANIGTAPTTSAFQFSTRVVSSGANANPTYVYATVFR